ncbi:MAG: glycosyltransferase [Pseudomonadota bacterium]
MKILVVGDWHSQVHEEHVGRALVALGHGVERFAWHQYFQSALATPPGFAALDGLNRKFQNKYLLGPIFRAVNRDLLARTIQTQPDALFVYRGTHITAATLRAIKQACSHTILVGYNNDDPFSPRQPRWAWRHFVNAIPEYDLMLAYRNHNIDDFRNAGSGRVKLMRSWFVPEVNHPVVLSQEDRARFECDVVFVGHNEPDGRMEVLEEIAQNGFRLRLFGPNRGFGENGWHSAVMNSSVLRKLAPVSLVWGEDYNKALCGAKVALCFLSKRNRDTYTRRCFEIPATRTMMLSEYSDDLATMYKEGRDVEFFRSREELVAKLRRYVHDDPLRQSVAAAGFKRAWEDGHDVVSRMRQLLVWINDVMA